MNICQFEEAACNTDSEDCRPIYLNKWLVIPSKYKCSCKEGYRIHPIHKCIGLWCFYSLWRIIYQLFWAHACPERMCTNGTQVPCKVPSLPNPTTRKGWPHHRGLRPLLFSNSDVGSFTSHKNKSVKVLWETYGFSSLCEKTRKSNHLQMSLQRQHFLLSYLKTLSVGPAGLWTRDLPLGRPVLSQLS